MKKQTAPKSLGDLKFVPCTLDDYVGQGRIRRRINVALVSANLRHAALPHVLFSGPPGMGKRTLADTLCKAIGRSVIRVNGIDAGMVGDFVGILTSLNATDVILIENIHGLDRKTSEYLCKPMNDFALDITIDSGPSARVVRLNLPSFTLIGTTSQPDRISPSLMASFPIVERFESYSPEELSRVAKLIYSFAGIQLDAGAAREIVAEGGCSSPRNVLHRILHIRDYVGSLRLNKHHVNKSMVKEALRMLAPDTRVNDTRPVRQPNAREVLHADPLRRRYQVFISSTYEDLKDERRLAMQALLETKCIPTGMELFPAASDEQWELIKRVIDDCDYYIVILGSRYGSLGPNRVSFTEMEFDYAVSAGKSVIGFINGDPKSRPVEKSDKTANDRKKFVGFERKLKQRLCKRWTTPEGLSSAIKSAILNAIESDPKPGWIRSSDLPASFALSELRRGQTSKSG